MEVVEDNQYVNGQFIPTENNNSNNNSNSCNNNEDNSNSDSDDNSKTCECVDINTCSHGFRTPLKRDPYLPYTGTSLKEVIASFWQINRGTTISSAEKRKELGKLLRHVNGK